MSDLDDLQGFWKIISHNCAGANLAPEGWWAFKGDRLYDINPQEVDDPTDRKYVTLNEAVASKEMTVYQDWNGPDGPRDPKEFHYTKNYELDGDRLNVRLNDESWVLSRHEGPDPQSREPSGISITDPVLGRFVWNDNYDWYELDVSVGDRLLSLTLFPETPDQAEPLIERARSIVERFPDVLSSVKRYAVDALLDLKNVEWSDDDDTEITAAEFERRMALVGLSVEADCSVTFCFNDDDMFCGHRINVSIDKNDRCTKATI
jgi:uncharacterized protein (TIGR03067 family)